jgi:hypothetical protein
MQYATATSFLKASRLVQQIRGSSAPKIQDQYDHTVKMQGCLYFGNVFREEARAIGFSLDNTPVLDQSLHLDVQYPTATSSWRTTRLAQQTGGSVFECTTSTILDSKDPGRVPSYR